MYTIALQSVATCTSNNEVLGILVFVYYIYCTLKIFIFIHFRFAI